MILTDPISWIVASLTRSSAVRPRNTLLYQINELNCGESYRETSYQPNQMNCRKDEKSEFSINRLGGRKYMLLQNGSTTTMHYR